VGNAVHGGNHPQQRVPVVLSHRIGHVEGRLMAIDVLIDILGIIPDTIQDQSVSVITRKTNARHESYHAQHYHDDMEFRFHAPKLQIISGAAKFSA
jgi:hypothetical protein